MSVYQGMGGMLVVLLGSRDRSVTICRNYGDELTKDLLMMSLVQSLCLQGNCLRKVILLMINLLLVEELFFL
jgi:hypothetical protein